jgi:lipopolysaccharide transport system ATP-binding protein
MSEVAGSARPELAIQVQDVSKAYKYYRHNSDPLKEALTGRRYHEPHWALRGITFDVPKGNIVGVIGPNGAGKSTLLRIITGLLDPTSGGVRVKGRISAILELGTGFHPDFTGRQNIIIGGLCLGMSRDEIEARSSWIIDFSELGHVIDRPFRTYSSGMQARLTFATAISINPEVFIVDEALAAGDSFFVAKSFKRIRDICRSGATVLLVSHGTDQVAHLCDQAIWLDGGKIRAMGAAREVAKQYDYETHVRISEGIGQIIEIENTSTEVVTEHISASEIPGARNSRSSNSKTTPAETVSAAPAGWLRPLSGDEPEEMATSNAADAHQNEKRQIYRKGPVVIEQVRILGGDGVQRKVFRTWENVTVEVEYSCPAEYLPFESLGLAIGIEREKDLVLIAQFNTVNYVGDETVGYHEAPYRKVPATHGIMRAFLPRLQMMNGSYLLSLGLIPNRPGAEDFYEYHHRTYPIRVVTDGYPSGAAFYPIVEWRHEYSLGSVTGLSAKRERG